MEDDIKLLGSQPEWAIFRNTWRDFIGLMHGRNECFHNK